MGRTRDAAPGTPPDRPVQRLLAAGLLRQVDAETVILPRLVGQVLRGELPGPVELTHPTPWCRRRPPPTSTRSPPARSSTCCAKSRWCSKHFGATPVPELRSGGLGVRDVKRLTKVTGIDEQRLGLILEVTAAAGLIAAGMPEPEPHGRQRTVLGADGGRRSVHRIPDRGSAGICWRPRGWICPARPGLIGDRGPDGKPYAALSDSLYSTAAPLDRRLLLERARRPARRARASTRRRRRAR